MRVRALVNQRSMGEERSVGDMWELTPEKLAVKAISEGYVEPVGEDRKKFEKKQEK